jgi:hypothetical protein
MAKLEPQLGRTLFAPLIWRLAMKIEQVPWAEVSKSPAEAAYVLRSAQRLFKQDVHCISFDTWLEAEAAGVRVERDELGNPLGDPAPLSDPPAVDRVLAAESVARTVEVLRRLAAEAGDGVACVATMTAGATLQKRLGGEAQASADLVGYTREILVGLTRLYCEAGAGALLLLDEEPAEDGAGLDDYAALFNLAEYFATPVFILNRGSAQARASEAARSFGANYVAADAAPDGVVPLPFGAGSFEPAEGWIAMSRWEVDPDIDPNVVQGWRQRLARH